MFDFDSWLSDDAAFDRDWELATGGNLMVGEEMFSSLVDSFLNFGGYDDAIWANSANWAAGDGKAVTLDGNGGWSVAAGQTGGTTSSGSGVMDAINKIGSWMDQNKTLTGLLASGVLGALKGGGTDMAESVLAKEQVDLRTRQRISDSLTGMPTVAVNAPGALKRTGGAQVFDAQGKVLR